SGAARGKTATADNHAAISLIADNEEPEQKHEISKELYTKLIQAQSAEEARNCLKRRAGRSLRKN
ncbi:MAG: hypothetical protein ACSW78_05610, partial [Lachnospiraceae bacterium]